ncbi:hypothetical protein DPMN_057589 [Dreissena polymorpha]|uniref:Uncharacterized protein n=1 Tax=Dreissena polymorpha TaxID=45954 RepID=A0A9D4HC94_DREPO|nr:hypothetical protein DPMN_057589 [Dreissena polymorpha]
MCRLQSVIVASTPAVRKGLTDPVIIVPSFKGSTTGPGFCGEVAHYALPLAFIPRLEVVPVPSATAADELLAQAVNVVPSRVVGKAGSAVLL